MMMTTGGWECIYKGPMIERPVAALGVDLSLKGSAIKIPSSVRTNTSSNVPLPIPNFASLSSSQLQQQSQELINQKKFNRLVASKLFTVIYIYYINYVKVISIYICTILRLL